MSLTARGSQILLGLIIALGFGLSLFREPNSSSTYTVVGAAPQAFSISRLVMRRHFSITKEQPAEGCAKAVISNGNHLVLTPGRIAMSAAAFDAGSWVCVVTGLASTFTMYAYDQTGDALCTMPSICSFTSGTAKFTRFQNDA